MLQKYSKPAGGAAICVLRPPPLLVLVLRCWLKYCLENIHFCCCSVCEKAAFFRSGYSIFFRRAGRVVCVLSAHRRSSLAEILSSPKKYLPCWSSLQQQQCRVCGSKGPATYSSFLLRDYYLLCCLRSTGFEKRKIHFKVVCV